MLLLTTRIVKLDYDEDVIPLATRRGWKTLPSKNEAWYAVLDSASQPSILLKDTEVIILTFKYPINGISCQQAINLVRERSDICYPAAVASAVRILQTHGSVEAYFKKKLELEL